MSNLDLKLQAYKESMSVSDKEKGFFSKECRKLEKKLGISRINPREYMFLRMIADLAQLNKAIDLTKIARKAGYVGYKVKHPQIIVRDIDDNLFLEVVGFKKSDVEYELLKIAKQDEDLTNKLRALELLSKIRGMHSDQDKLQIQINAGFEIAD